MHGRRLTGAFFRDFFVSATWGDFWMFLGIGVLCLLLSAFLAGVRIGSLPVNPLRWHWWVVAHARIAPTLDENVAPFRIYRPYMLLWVASACCWLAAVLVLLAMAAGGHGVR